MCRAITTTDTTTTIINGMVDTTMQTINITMIPPIGIISRNN